MTTRKMLVTALLTTAVVLAHATDAQAFGKRKRGGAGCNGGGYGYGGGCSGGGYGYGGWSGGYGCGGGGYSYGGAHGAYYGSTVIGADGFARSPETMPTVVGTAGTVVPATGTTAGGAVVLPAAGTVSGQTYLAPAGGYYQGGRYVMPAGGYYQNGQYVMPAGGYYQNGQYVTPAGYGTFQSGFGAGVIDGTLGTGYYYPYGSTPAGGFGYRAGRGIFRR